VLESAAMGAGGAGERPVRVGMIGLGCAKNLVDAEIMLGYLTQQGVEITNEFERADVVVVNTCAFIDDAKRESIEAILEVAELKRQGKVRRLVVAGCLAQRHGEELAAELPEVDAFIGLDELERIGEAASGALGREHLPMQGGAWKLYDHTSPRLLASGGVYAYLKVAEGCDNPCSFCQIPAIRGRFRSRRPESLIAEARRLEEAGVRELVLVAQDTTRYGEDLGLGRDGLRRLLEELLAKTSLPWIRFLYAYPATLDAGIFPLMRSEPRLVPYLDLPLQHCSRAVLKAMRRGGDATSYRELIERARCEVPGIAIRSTFIVGFPVEGEGEFEELEGFLEAVRLDHVGVFAYSCQSSTPAAELGDPVPARIKERRRRKLMRLQERIARERLRKLQGHRAVVLVEGASEESELLLQGRLASQAPEVDGRVLIASGTAAAGDLVEVRVRKTYAFEVVGDVVGVVQVAPRAASASPGTGRAATAGG
jgi:ribosomal protein S12 methylthiotransferase